MHHVAELPCTTGSAFPAQGNAGLECIHMHGSPSRDGVRTHTANTQPGSVEQLLRRQISHKVLQAALQLGVRVIHFLMNCPYLAARYSTLIRPTSLRCRLLMWVCRPPGSLK